MQPLHFALPTSHIRVKNYKLRSSKAKARYHTCTFTPRRSCLLGHRIQFPEVARWHNLLAHRDSSSLDICICCVCMRFWSFIQYSSDNNKQLFLFSRFQSQLFIIIVKRDLGEFLLHVFLDFFFHKDIFQKKKKNCKRVSWSLLFFGCTFQGAIISRKNVWTREVLKTSSQNDERTMYQFYQFWRTICMNILRHKDVVFAGMC